MTAITLPANTVWPTPTLGIAIARGDANGPLPPWPGEKLIAPAAWVRYVKSCRMCDDRKRNGLDALPSSSTCRDGRQAWTVRCHNIECGDYRLSNCPSCGRIDHGPRRQWSATIEVVPVVGFGEWEITARPVPAVTVDDYGQAVLMTDCGDPEGAHGVPLALDPLPVPGRDFGVVIDCVEVAP